MTTALAALAAGSAVQAQTPIPPSAPDFAIAAAQSDTYEILAADDALTQSQNPQVRAFAEQMAQDHIRTRASLQSAVSGAGLESPPRAMSSDQASTLAALQSLRGADFDKAYARQQVLAHSQALAVEQSYASDGKEAHLQDAARGAVPIIQHHLDMAQQLNTALGGS